MARITPCLENGKISQVNFLDEDEIGFGSTEFIVFREKEGMKKHSDFGLIPKLWNVNMLEDYVDFVTGVVYATGTTILHAGKSIKHMNFILPEDEIIEKFNRIGDPILFMILMNISEIAELTKLRDILLPKLMSGEINVSNINLG